jgi:hypothetical protein
MPPTTECLASFTGARSSVSYQTVWADAVDQRQPTTAATAFRPLAHCQTKGMYLLRSLWNEHLTKLECLL